MDEVTWMFYANGTKGLELIKITVYEFLVLAPYTGKIEKFSTNLAAKYTVKRLDRPT